MSTVIGVFENKDSAERALNKIREAGITNDKISMVAKEDILNGDDRNRGRGNQDVTTGATTGGAIGGLTGLLAGAGTLAIPGVGPVLAAGPIAAGLSGVAAGGLAGSLIDMGIPQDRGEHYEEEVRRGRILATVEADRNKVNDVASYLKEYGARDVETH